MNRMNKIKFEDGSDMPNVDTATYLGTTLTERLNAMTEINSKIKQAHTTLTKLELHWKKQTVT